MGENVGKRWGGLDLEIILSRDPEFLVTPLATGGRGYGS